MMKESRIILLHFICMIFFLFQLLLMILGISLMKGTHYFLAPTPILSRAFKIKPKSIKILVEQFYKICTFLKELPREVQQLSRERLGND